MLSTPVMFMLFLSDSFPEKWSSRDGSIKARLGDKLTVLADGDFVESEVFLSGGISWIVVFQNTFPTSPLSSSVL